MVGKGAQTSRAQRTPVGGIVAGLLGYVGHRHHLTVQPRVEQVVAHGEQLGEHLSELFVGHLKPRRLRPIAW